MLVQHAAQSVTSVSDSAMQQYEPVAMTGAKS